MRIFCAISLLLIFAACGSTKTATTASTPASKSGEPDNNYLTVFYDGLQLKGRGQMQEAITAFNRALELRPSDDASAYAISECYLALNDRAKAAEYTLKASKLDPENVWYTQELAYMYYDQGKFPEAEKVFRQLVTKQPDNLDWQFGYAEVLKNQGKKKEAIAAYDKMEGIIGVMPDLSLQKYDLYRRMGDDQKALAELEKARKAYPDELGILGTYVDYYFEKNDIDGAKNMLEALVAANPDNARANFTLAEIYLRENQLPKAYAPLKIAFASTEIELDSKMQMLLKIYDEQVKIEEPVFALAKQLTEVYPNDAKPWSLLGDFYVKNDDEEHALPMYEKALEFDQSKYPIWNQVLLLEYKQHHFDDLYKHARLAASLFPSLASIQLMYTVACVQTKRYQEAIDAADVGKNVVVNDDATEAEFYAQKGEALVRSGKYKDGFENFDIALMSNPKNELIKNNFAALLALTNYDFPKANKLIDEVMADFPNHPVFTDTKGLVLFQEGKFSEAKHYFETAKTLDPKDGNIYDHLGDAEFKLGNHSKALEDWEKAKDLGANSSILETKIKTKSYHAPQL